MKQFVSMLLAGSLALTIAPAFATDTATPTLTNAGSGSVMSTSSSSSVSSSSMSSSSKAPCQEVAGRNRILCLQQNIASGSRRAARVIKAVTKEVVKSHRQERLDLRKNQAETRKILRATQKTDTRVLLLKAKTVRETCSNLAARERAACLYESLTGRTIPTPAMPHSSSSSSASSVSSSSSSMSSSSSSVSSSSSSSAQTSSSSSAQ